MKQQIAVMIYPYFSMQEIANACALFRWYCDSQTVIFASGMEPVLSEEGILVQPQKRLAEFRAEDYDCLVLSGCSDFRPALQDAALMEFVKRLKDFPNLLIGAICSGPLLLAIGGVLQGKKFVNQLFWDMNERLLCIEEQNFVCQPVVTDGNIVTALGSAYADFAITLARKLGYDCPDTAYNPSLKALTEDDYKARLDAEGMQEFENAFADYL